MFRDRIARPLLAIAIAIATTLVLGAVAPAASAYGGPDRRLTPGAVGAYDGAHPSAAEVCAPGFARRVRHPYDRPWRRYRSALFAEYGIPHALWSQYTVDHLIPLELGGRAFGVRGGVWDLRNVWPQPKAQAREKDRVESALHAAVCRHRGYRGLHLSLPSAERAIARDWSQTPVGLPSARRR